MTDLLDEYLAFKRKLPNVDLCNCVGPQPGETKCPCALRLEAKEAELKPELTGRSSG